MNAIIYRDSFLVLGSFLCVFVLIWLHTHSLFIGVVAFSEILLSLMGFTFLYRVVIGIETIGILHTIALFLLLAIGVDDVFVFWDTWKHSALLQLVEQPPHLTAPQVRKHCLLNRKRVRLSVHGLKVAYMKFIFYKATMLLRQRIEALRKQEDDGLNQKSEQKGSSEDDGTQHSIMRPFELVI